MDHFENIVKILLEAEGFWVLSSFKVDLTKNEKVATGKHTIPRPEIDLIAYRPADAKILAIEVKSFFDSTGVRYSDLIEQHEVASGRYKLFTTKNYRDIVFKRLSQDLIDRGFLKTPLNIELGLVAGNVKNGDGIKIENLAKERGWFYWSPDDIKEKITKLSSQGYENEAVHICAKILLR